MTSTRVTLKQIALQLGVSHAAVSMALNDRPGVSKVLREKIKRTAQEMGYRPDPALSALVAYRAEVRPHKEFEVLAYLSGWHSTEPEKSRVWRSTAIDPARERAKFYGFELREFWLSGEPDQHRRLGRTLHRQGIRGLLLGATPHEDEPPDLPWEAFSTVVLGRSNAPPGLDRCCANIQQEMQLAVRKLVDAGANRIGVAASQHQVTWTDYEPIAGFEQAFRLERGRFRRVAPLVWKNEEDAVAVVGKWLRLHRVDAVLTSHPKEVGQAAVAIGMSVPEDIQIVNLAKGPKASEAGLLQPDVLVAQTAVDLLHTKLRLRQRGLPVVRKTTLVDGIWSPGWTLRS